MCGDPRCRVLERRARIAAASASKRQRAYRVPRVRRALARVQLSGVLRGQLAFERGHRTRLVTARQVDEAAEPVQRHRTETRAARVLVGERGEAGVELALGFAEHLTRDV